MIRSRGTRGTPRSRVILFVLLVAIPIVVVVASIPANHMLDEAAIDVAGIVAYGGVGGIVIFRRNGHLVGWRRFNRSRFDSERTMEGLSRRLSSQVDLLELGRELQVVAHQTMQTTTVSVWLRAETR